MTSSLSDDSIHLTQNIRCECRIQLCKSILARDDPLEAWISQVYIASLIRGDQSSMPARQASRTDEISAPTTADIRPRAAIIS